MPLTSRQAFNAGLLLRMTQEGLDHDQMVGRVDQLNEKMAGFIKQALPFEPFSAGVNAAKFLGGWGAFGLAAAPPLLGAVAGNQLSHVLDADSTDVEEARKHELIFEYQRLADEAKRQTAANRDIKLQSMQHRRRAPY